MYMYYPASKYMVNYQSSLCECYTSTSLAGSRNLWWGWQVLKVTNLKTANIHVHLSQYTPTCMMLILPLSKWEIFHQIQCLPNIFAIQYIHVIEVLTLVKLVESLQHPLPGMDPVVIQIVLSTNQIAVLSCRGTSTQTNSESIHNMYNYYVQQCTCTCTCIQRIAAAIGTSKGLSSRHLWWLD